MTTAAAVAQARSEILQCSDAEIERNTAQVWCARAMAAYQLACERRCTRWMLRAVGYHHEAVEHAAGVSAHFVAHTEAALERFKALALAVLEGG